MSDPKNVERITNDDGSELKVVAYDDHIVVHTTDEDGNYTGHVTDWFNNSGVHVHDEEGDRWEGDDSSASDNTSSGSDDDSSSSSDDSDKCGCFITSAVCANLRKTDDCSELVMFRHFRDTFMQKTLEMRQEVKEYYRIAPKICNAINKLGKQRASSEYARIWEYSLEPAIIALKAHDEENAYNIYKEMVLELKQYYLVQ